MRGAHPARRQQPDGNQQGTEAGAVDQREDGHGRIEVSTHRPFPSVGMRNTFSWRLAQNRSLPLSHLIHRRIDVIDVLEPIEAVCR